MYIYIYYSSDNTVEYIYSIAQLLPLKKVISDMYTCKSKNICHDLDTIALDINQTKM